MYMSHVAFCPLDELLIWLVYGIPLKRVHYKEQVHMPIE